MAKLLNKLINVYNIRKFSSLTNSNIHPFATELAIPKPASVIDAWIENFDTIEEKKLGLIQLHPQIFQTTPRLDIGKVHLESSFLSELTNINFSSSECDMAEKVSICQFCTFIDQIRSTGWR
jgi:hypothetical protein